jgi:hypothetical protein
MNRIALMLAVLLLAATAQADTSDLRAASRSKQKHHLNAVIVRDFGIGLAVAGTILSLAGAATLCVGDSSCHGAVAATTLIIGGQSMLGSGTALWAVGKKHADASEDATLSLAGGGVRLTF